MFVMDPRTFATRLLMTGPSQGRSIARGVLEDTNSSLVRCFVWLKSASERWFTHLFLLLALVIYAIIGGAIFNRIEGDFEDEQNAIIRELHYPVSNITQSTVIEMWRLRSQYPLPPDNAARLPALALDHTFYKMVNQLLDHFEETVRRQCQLKLDLHGIEQFAPTDEWTFLGSVFFSMTVFTTIGYGDKPPKTDAGKVAVMLYSFVGIPLLLIVLADFGKIFTKLIKLMLIYIRRLYYNRSFRQVRRATRTAKIQGAIADAFAKMQRPPPFFVDPVTGKLTMWPSKPDEEEGGGSSDLEAGSKRGGGTPTSARRSPHAPAVTFSPATPTTATPPETPMPADAVILDFDDIDEEFDLPVSLALTILFVYLLLGAFIFWASEKWSLLNAFYFVFISMSTIGFGDLVPGVHVLIGAFIYFLFGLALTSMCINVLQLKLSSTFELARMTIEESIGLDPSTPITMVVPDGVGGGGGDSKSGGSSEKSSKDNSRRSSQEVVTGGGGGDNKTTKKELPKGVVQQPQPPPQPPSRASREGALRR